MSMTPAAIAGTVSDIIPGLPNVPPVDYTSRDYQAVLNDLVALIPTYLPEWTDRSPGDFGIVLMELFAYTCDILNFYADRIANEAYLATARQRQSVLNLAYLLDYTPHGNVAATTTLQFSIANPSSNPVQIPAGFQVMTTQLGTQMIPFETNSVLTIWGDGYMTVFGPVAGTGLAGQTYALSAVYQGHYATVPAYDGQTENVKVSGVAWTQAPGNSFTGQTAAAKMYIVVNGNSVQFGGGTAGSPGAIPQTTDTIEIDYYAAPPGQYSAQVDATQGTTQAGEILGSSNGTPNQVFSLFRTPVVDGSQVIMVDEGTGPKPWTAYQRLVDAFDTDLAYTLSVNANGVVIIQFGDGVNGRIPIPGAAITANYMVGGGAMGNVPANTLTAMGSAVPGVLTVTNPEQAVGGADAESLDHIRIHAPLALTAINRAVTLDDYAALLLNLGEVDKASAASSSVNAVTLYIHPHGNFITDIPTLVNRVQALVPLITNSGGTGYLDTKKIATVGIQVLPPQYNKAYLSGGTNLVNGYVPVNCVVNIQVLPQYHQNAVQAAVVAAINTVLSYDMVDFGYRVSLSIIYHTVQEVEGVDYCVVTTLCRAEATPQTLGDVTTAAYEIPMMNSVTVTPSGGIIF